MSIPVSLTSTAKVPVPGFEIGEEIGRGGMAEVFSATQLSLNRQVALKILSAFHDPEQRERFQNESRIIGSLNHRNIITIYDVGSVDGCVYIAMEYLGSGDLSQKILQGPLQAFEALETATAIGDCLSFAHSRGIVHRDVKPENILFHADGTPVLTDFGIASDLTADSRLTAHGQTVGSPCYVSPEQALGEQTDGRTDIYSLGIVLYEMLVGRAPFQESSSVETMAARLSRPAPRLPQGLRACQPLLDRMLARERDDRFCDAAEMVETIRNLQLELSSSNALEDGPRSGRSAWKPQFLSLWEPLREALIAAVGKVRVALGTPRAGKTLLTIALVAILVEGIGWIMQPAEVRDYLSNGEAALDADRLSRPRNDSAIYYFRKALVVDPGNDDALDGLHDVAEVYADRAEEDLEAREFANAKMNVDRGLDAQPGNERLLVLEEDTKKLRSIPEKLVRGVRSIFE